MKTMIFKFVGSAAELAKLNQRKVSVCWLCEGSGNMSVMDGVGDDYETVDCSMCRGTGILV